MITLKPIGVVHSPYKKRGDAPSQGRDKDELFRLEIFDEYKEGLNDIEGMSHLIVLYWLDRSNRNSLIANPPMDNKSRGVFSTRSPSRPNPIAFNVVDFIRRENNVLYVRKMDALDKSPIIDIKPYSERLDAITNTNSGWIDKTKYKGEKGK